MKNVSRTKGRVPGPVKQGRAHVLRMNLTEATLIGKWLLEANEVPKHLQSEEMDVSSEK